MKPLKTRVVLGRLQRTCELLIEFDSTARRPTHQLSAHQHQPTENFFGCHRNMLPGPVSAGLSVESKRITQRASRGESHNHLVASSNATSTYGAFKCPRFLASIGYTGWSPNASGAVVKSGANKRRDQSVAPTEHQRRSGFKVMTFPSWQHSSERPCNGSAATHPASSADRRACD